MQIKEILKELKIDSTKYVGTNTVSRCEFILLMDTMIQ